MTTDRAVTTAELRKRMKDLVRKMDRLLEEGGTDDEADALNKEAEDLMAVVDVLDPAAAEDEPKAQA